MAPLEHADSIIEESVISTSPSRHVDTDNEASTSVAEPSFPRRVIKTYGRPKVDPIGQDNTENIYENRAHTLRTAPPDTERLVIPESEDTSAYSGTSVPSFGWREQLRQIDNDYNDKSKGEFSTTIITPSGSPADADLKDASESLFDGTLSSLLSEAPHSPLENSDIENTDIIKMNIDESFGPNTSAPSYGKATSMNNSSRNESLDTPPTSPFTLTSTSAKNSKVKLDEKPRYKQKGMEKQRPRKASKKELTEIQKESARLLAERTVEIKRQEQRPGPSLRNLFGILRSSASAKVDSKDSDPIISFSSPNSSNLLQKVEGSDKTGAISPIFFRHSTPRKPQTSLTHEDPEQGSDIEMPTAESILETEYARLAEQSKAKELKERKLQALQALKVTSTSSSDDDLEVEQMVTPRSRRFCVKPIKNISGLKPESKYKRDSGQKQSSEINLELAAKPLFDVRRGKTDKSSHKNTVSHQSLNQILLHRAEKQGSEIEGKKKEKWIQRGGSLKGTAPSGESSLGSWLSRGLAEDDKHVDTEAESEDEGHYEDEYQPPEERDEELSDNERSRRETLEDIDRGDISNESVTADEDDDEDKENQQPFPRKARVPVIVDSDDENDPMLIKSSQPLVLVRDSCRLGTDSNSEGGDDYYKDEDKENQNDEPFGIDFVSTVESSNVRPTPRGSLSVLNEDLLEEIESPLSRTGGSHHRILRVLHEQDKENTFESDHSSPSDRVTGLSFSTPVENFEGSTLVSSESFSQLFAKPGEITDKEPSPTPLLAKGFSQFFSPSGSKSQENPLEISGGKFGVPFQLTKGKNFEFTQANALLPSVQISESQRREVDNMFHKDQEFKLDEARRVKTEAEPSSSKRNEVAYFGSFIASPQTDISHMIRQPLATMSLKSIDSFEEITMVDEESSPQFKRTRFRRERPETRSESPSPTAVHKVRNVFELLKDANIRKHKKSVDKAIKSDFIQGEAQESDDELYAGFGGKEKDDEDNEEEDQDAIIEGLVDDAELDDKTMATELVLEKHKEFEAQDDAVLTKLHQDAVEGKLRTKRKNGGLEFDDSESEDEHRPPKHFLKKRRIEGDTLDACGQNPETRAFFNAYQQPLLDEDQLNIGPFIGPLVQPLEKESQEDTSEEEDNDDKEETIDVSTIRDELRKRALNLEDEMARTDLEDVTWVDADEGEASDDIDIQIEQEGMLQGNSKLQNTHLSTLRFNGDFMTKNATSQEKTRLQAWASQESQTRTAGGRGGFSRRDEKEKSTAGSRKSLNSHKYLTPGHMPDKLKKSSTTSSLISHVQKQKRFED